MDICFVAGKRGDKFITTANTLFDSNKYTSYPNIDKLCDQAPIKHEHFDRVLLFDDSLYLRDDFINLSNYFEYLSQPTELVFIARDSARVSELRESFQHPLSTSIVLEGNITQQLFKALINSPLAEIRERFSTEDEEVSTVHAVVTESARQYKASSLNPDLLNLSSAGMNHVDTGFLDGDDSLLTSPGADALPSVAASTYPPTQLKDFTAPSQTFPGYSPSAKEDLPIILSGSRITVALSESYKRSALYCALHAMHYAERGHTTLYIDLQSENHGVQDTLDAPDALVAFQPSMANSLLYQEGSTFIATNGFQASASVADLQAVLPLIPLFDYTVVDMPLSQAPTYLPLIQAAQPTTSVHWLIQPTVQGIRSALNSIFDLTQLDDVTASAISHAGWVVTGTLPDDARRLLQALHGRYLWNRYDFTRQFEALLA